MDQQQFRHEVSSTHGRYITKYYKILQMKKIEVYHINGIHLLSMKIP